jgi:ribosomal-protein-alanine N-acetyltransferase
MMTAIRRGGPADLEAVAAIQYCCPEAAHWDPRDYLAHDFWVAAAPPAAGQPDGPRVAGFLVLRRTAPDEGEILNLAVSPDFRRQGVATRLMETALQNFSGAFYLEVRESNEGAREFYKSLSFQEVSRRPAYYQSPPETAIVMKFHSC